MDNIFEIFGKIVAAVGGTGVIIVAVSTTLSKFGVELLTNRLSRKDNLSDEYRAKKDSALEELLNEFSVFNNSSIAESELILVPRHRCPARIYNKHFIPISFGFLEDLDKLKEYRAKIIGIVSKNQFWFSDELNTIFNHYLSYLYNVQYIYMLKMLKPQKLCAYFLSIDLNSMHSKISQEIRNCYFGKHNKKYKSISNEKYWANMNKSYKDFSLAVFTMMLANEKQKKEFDYIKHEESNIYKHYNLCMSCELNCPLAKQDFICFETEEE